MKAERLAEIVTLFEVEFPFQEAVRDLRGLSEKGLPGLRSIDSHRSTGAQSQTGPIASTISGEGKSE